MHDFTCFSGLASANLASGLGAPCCHLRVRDMRRERYRSKVLCIRFVAYGPVDYHDAGHPHLSARVCPFLLHLWRVVIYLVSG